MTTQMKDFIKSLDLFNKPFEFFVGEKKNKSTFVGGFLSISVVAVSIAYLYYLLNMYFDNKFEPKITSSMALEDELISLDVKDSFFIFEYLINQVPLNLHEKQIGKTYLSYSLEYAYFDPVIGIDSILYLPLVKCADPKFSNYLCVDSASIQNFNISMNAITNMSSAFTLYIDFCNDLMNQNCATKQETMDLILRPENYFLFYTKIRQYSSDQRQFEEGYKLEYIRFDSKLVIYSRISLIKSQTTVIDGMIIQDSTQSDDIFDYKRIDTYFSRDYSENVMNYQGFGILVFENNQQRNIITIQHAMITEVLAQFMGILNPLLIIGILAKMLAESQIIEDINNILLKEYYKLTALKLVSHRENKLHLIDEGQSQTDLNQSEAIVSLANKLRESDFAEQSMQYFEMSFFKRAKLFFGKLLGQKPDLSQQKKGSDSRIYHQILQQTMKRINVFEVYKDIIQLKMFIKLMLSKEQFAAMQFCGSEIPEDEDIETRKRLVKQAVINKLKSKIKLKGQKQNVFPDAIKSMIQKNKGFLKSNPLKLGIKKHEVKTLEDDTLFNKQIQRKEPEKQEIRSQESGDKQNKIEEIEVDQDSQPQEIQKKQNKIINLQIYRLICCQISFKQFNFKMFIYSIIMEVKEVMNQGQLEIVETIQKSHNNILSSQTDQEEKERINKEKKENEITRNSSVMPYQKIRMEDRKALKNEGDEMEIDISSQTEDEKQKRENELQIQGQDTTDKLQQQQFFEETISPSSKDMKRIEQLSIPLSTTQRIPYIEQLINQKLLSPSPNNGSLFESGFQSRVSNFRSHLCEMDQIELDQDIQEKFLKTFLQDFHNKLSGADNKIEKLSCIDRNIYESLLVKDKNLFSDSN